MLKNKSKRKLLNWTLILGKLIYCAALYCVRVRPVYSSSSLPNVLSMNSSLPMNTSSVSHPPPSPHVSDVCVFGSESGLPAGSHMLFYPSVPSGTVGRPPSLSPPPASLSLFWLTVSLTRLSVSPPSSPPSCFSLFSGCLGLCLSRGEGWCLSLLSSSPQSHPSLW